MVGISPSCSGRNAHRRGVRFDALGKVLAARDGGLGPHHEYDGLADQVGDRRELEVIDPELAGQQRAQGCRGLNEQPVAVAGELAKVIQRDAITAARFIRDRERRFDQLVRRVHDRLQRACGVVHAAARSGGHDELNALVRFPFRRCGRGRTGTACDANSQRSCPCDVGAAQQVLNPVQVCHFQNDLHANCVLCLRGKCGLGTAVPPWNYTVNCISGD